MCVCVFLLVREIDSCVPDKKPIRDAKWKTDINAEKYILPNKSKFSILISIRNALFTIHFFLFEIYLFVSLLIDTLKIS